MSPLDKKIRVAIMADVIDRRPERTLVARRLAEYLLTREDVELTLIHYEIVPDDTLYDRAHEIIIPTETFPFRSRFLSFLKFAITTKEQFDIVHWLVGRVYPFFWWLPTKKTMVTAFDGGSVFAPGPWIVSRFIYNWVLRLWNSKIAALVGSSSFGSEQIRSAYWVPQKRMRIVPVGIDTSYQPREQTDIASALRGRGLSYKGYVLYVGGMQPHKNVSALIAAYTMYRKDGGSGKLVIVGDPAYGGGVVERVINESPYKSDIIAFPYSSNEELPKIYNGALMYVHPSLNEGFGLPPVEAMASGTPVVSSNAASLPEVTGGAALLVDAKKPQALADAMLKVHNDLKLQEELSRKGIESAKRYTWEKMGEQYVSLYHSLLRSSS